MAGLVVQCKVHHHHHRVIFGARKKPTSLCSFYGFLPNRKMKLFKSRNGLDDFWGIGERKVEKKFAFGVKVSAAAAASSSPSPALGSSASDFPVSEPLAGEKKKKKQRSIAGVDQDELVEPRQLADSDSCFCEFKGVEIHYKLCEPEAETPSSLLEENSKAGVPMILLHGFGASAFSWHRVMKSFAQITGSKVLAFDRPAFGLTSRALYSESSLTKDGTTPLNPYSMAFSVLATVYFIDFLASQKAVLVGHSAGSLTAVEAYFEAPERVSALILVAPAILTPLSSPKVADKSQKDKEKQTQEINSGSDKTPNLLVRFGQILSKWYQFIVSAILWIFRGMLDMANFLSKKALAAILRSAAAVTLVRMFINKFGVAAIRNAWYDASQVTDHILHGYTKPLRTKDWDRALVEYTAAMLTDPLPKLKPPLDKRLQEICCPVLIVTGDNDRLVPSWNSERLSRAIPGSQLEVIKNCGHLPHEEKPEEFVSVVAKFLQSVFIGSEALCSGA